MSFYVKNLPLDEPEPPRSRFSRKGKRRKRGKRRPYRHLLDGLPIRSMRIRADAEETRALRSSPGRWLVLAGFWGAVGLAVLSRRPEPLPLSLIPGLVVGGVAWCAAFLRVPLFRAVVSLLLLAVSAVWMLLGQALVAGIPGAFFSLCLLLGSLPPGDGDAVAEGEDGGG